MRDFVTIFTRAGLVVESRARVDQERTGIWLLTVTDAVPKTGSFSVLTPYPIPPELAERKVPNIGDGFIERAIFDQLVPHECRASFSWRVPLNDEAIEQINDAGPLILVGANQLNDNFTIAPGMTPEQFARIRVPVLPVGAHTIVPWQVPSAQLPPGHEPVTSSTKKGPPCPPQSI